METWPNFFIVGAPRAGTTSLYNYLKKIPGIYMSPMKEPHYFSESSFPEGRFRTIIRDKKKYLELFKKIKNEKIVGEASATYLSDPEAPNLIHHIIPNAFILASLRDPVERTFSHFLMHKSQGVLKPTFYEQLENELNNIVDPTEPNIHLESGLYSSGVKKHLNIFGENQVKIIIFEEFIKNTKGTVEEILKFLNIY